MNLTGYELWNSGKPFKLARGGSLPELQIAYETWGEMNHSRNNVILLQCGMSASSHARSHHRNPAKGWWEDFIGPGKPLDTNLFQVLCTNNLGGCFGSSGPSSVDGATGKRFASRFPRFEVQDQVAAQFALLDHLGVQKVHACVGASLGGMQSLCAAAMFPDRVGKFVSISACAKSFPGSIAFRHAQRQAVMSDPNWNGGDYYDGELPANGLRLARQMGTITYRSGLEWSQRFGSDNTEKDPEGLRNEFLIENYLTHQGEKWVGNYDPNSMIFISKAMDGFSLEKQNKDDRWSLVEGLLPAKHIPALVIGVQTDVLFPVWQQKQIADSLRAAGNKRVVYYELDSIYGHDAFLLEQQAIGPAVKGHLEQEPGGAMHLWQEQANSASRILQAAVVRGNQADALRDIFRTLAAGEEEVETAQLRKVLNIVYKKTLGEKSGGHLERILDERLPKNVVRLPELLALREAFQQEKPDVYLP